jgi:hypothetical protein
MAQPPVYIRRYDFVAFQTINPTKPLPAQEHENEYNAIALSLNGVIGNLGLIQRDDGELNNGSVGWDQLSPEVIVGIQQPYDWEPNHQYTSGNLVYAPAPNASKIYRALDDHLSSSDFDVDLAAGLWTLQIDFAHAADEANNAAADAEAALDAFEDIFLGDHPAPPTTDNDGDPLQTGALYFDTSLGEMRVWNGASWQWAGQSDTAGVRRWNDRIGDVVLTYADITTATAADPLATDADVAAALVSANAYTDSRHASQAADITGGDATTLASAKAYSDAGDAALTTVINGKVGEAPNDGKQYARKNEAWAEFASPIPTDAPSDGSIYGRKDAAWAKVVGGATPSDTPPASPADNQLWFETDTGAMFFRYNDGNSTQWVQVNANTGIPEAPLDDQRYLRRNGGWENTGAKFNRLTTAAQWIQLSVEPGAVYRGVFFGKPNADCTLYCQMGLVAGNIIAGAGSYAYQQLVGAGGTVAASAASGPGIPVCTIDANTGWGPLIEFTLFTADVANYAHFTMHGGGASATGPQTVYVTDGVLATLGGIVELRLGLDTGTLYAGSFLKLDKIV